MVHGFLLPDTNVNTMVVPGFVAEVRTRFERLGETAMPCHEFLRPRPPRDVGACAVWCRKSDFANLDSLPKDEL